MLKRNLILLLLALTLGVVIVNSPLKSNSESSMYSTVNDGIVLNELLEIDNFTKSLHPEILTQLTNSIQNSTESLKLLGQNYEQKTKETIEKEALLYKELRELMSTKEFVEQYDSGIKDD